MKRIAAAVVAFLALAVMASPSMAHPLDAAGGGWARGFAHPFAGLDHILAMIAVGAWAAQVGRRAMWLLPVAFPLAMAAGAVLGLAGVPVPGVEAAIAISVLMLGALIALQARLPLAAALGLVALFAVFHGHAHGAEIPQAGSPLLYGLGFMAATVVLHGVGLGLGHVARLPRGAAVLRAGGSAVAAAGVVLLAAL